MSRIIGVRDLHIAKITQDNLEGTMETPDKDLRRARKALPGGPGGDEKTGFPERKLDGKPGKRA